MFGWSKLFSEWSRDAFVKAQPEDVEKRLKKKDPRIAERQSRYFKELRAIWLADTSKRFHKLSRGNGGGVWPPRKPKASFDFYGRKHYFSKNSRHPLLWKTGALFQGVASGSFLKWKIENGDKGLRVEILFGPKDASNPTLTKGLAAIHHFGLGRVPARTLFEPPKLLELYDKLRKIRPDL